MSYDLGCLFFFFFLLLLFQKNDLEQEYFCEVKQMIL